MREVQKAHYYRDCEGCGKEFEVGKSSEYTKCSECREKQSKYDEALRKLEQLQQARDADADLMGATVVGWTYTSEYDADRGAFRQVELRTTAGAKITLDPSSRWGDEHYIERDNPDD